jgi:hypothetical protein
MYRRKDYFPNLELGWTAYDRDSAFFTGLSSHLYVAGAVTMERLDQFWKLALLLGKSGRREPCIICRYLSDTD